MEVKVRKYVDHLFSEIYETRQLGELKEEMRANLLERINDLIANGYSEEEAYTHAISSLGDMGELVENLKKASTIKMQEDFFKSQPVDKKHVIGYVLSSALLLIGLMVAGFVYLEMKDLFLTVEVFMPFFIVSTASFIYFGLTQETLHDYGMNGKRALAYSLAASIILIGIFVSGILYFKGSEFLVIFATFMPFLAPSAIIFIYLGLTEKSRRKMNLDSDWQKQWVEYYRNPQSMMVRGTLSGALWIFSFAGFFIIGFTLGWRFSWIIFILAIGFEVLIEAYFTARRKKA